MLDMVDPVDRVDSVGYVDDLDNVDKSPGPIECSAFVAGVAEEVAHDEAVAAALHGFVAPEVVSATATHGYHGRVASLFGFKQRILTANHA
jgi:hypothetical protein